MAPIDAFDPPPILRNHAESLGEEGLRWLKDLPGIVEALTEKWGLRPGPPMAGGSAALVLPVEVNQAGRAVLKIGLPQAGHLKRQAEVLRHADGRGYAKLLRECEASNALLLEALGPPLASEQRPIELELEVLSKMLGKAWITLKGPHRYTNGQEKATRLADFIQEYANDSQVPCNLDTRRRAQDYALERAAAYRPAECVLAHGDPHGQNALRDPQAESDNNTLGPGYRFVDPDGLFIERAYDLGVLMRGGNDVLLDGDAIALGQRRAERLASHTGVDVRAIWQWGFIERVTTGLYLWKTRRRAEAISTLAVADRWASLKP